MINYIARKLNEKYKRYLEEEEEPFVDTVKIPEEIEIPREILNSMYGKSGDSGLPGKSGVPGKSSQIGWMECNTRRMYFILVFYLELYLKLWKRLKLSSRLL